MRQPIVVYQELDPSMLGDGTTQADLDTYRGRLETHLCAHFHRDICVTRQPSGDSVRRYCPSSGDIDAYVAHLCTGDGWLQFVEDECE